MKPFLLTLAMVALATISPAAAQTVTSGHWDISAHGHDGTLELNLHNHDANTEAPLNQSIITYDFGTNAPVAVSVGSNNLGLLYASPADELEADDLGMPFIGFSAEELTSPYSGSVSFTMTGFSYTGTGAGRLFLFQGSNLIWNSTAGEGNFGFFNVNVGSHSHGRFGFSDLGSYEVTLVAGGANSDGGDPATFSFNVVPEPSSGALLLAGMAALAAARRRRL